MKVFKFVSFILILMTLGLPAYCQENSIIPKRTPEQEAAKQTEKLQQELDLNQDQVKEVYKINLRYARERQISNKRSEAMERMKNKNADIQQVLSQEQNNRLQTKRYERTYLETNTFRQNQSINPAGFRSSSTFRSVQTVRVPSSSDLNINRNNYRPVNPDFHPGTQQGQAIKRSITTTTPANRFQNSPSTYRSSSRNQVNTPGRAGSGMPFRSNASNRQTRPTYSPGRTETPSNPSRK